MYCLIEVNVCCVMGLDWLEVDCADCRERREERRDGRETEAHGCSYAESGWRHRASAWDGSSVGGGRWGRGCSLGAGELKALRIESSISFLEYYEYMTPLFNLLMT